MASGLFDDDEFEDLDASVEDMVDDASPAQVGEGEPREPRNNPDLFGHEAVEQALLADFNAGRLPHAFVFSGPAGIGKATLAYRLARFLFKNGGDQEASLFGEPEKPTTLHVGSDDPVFRRVASGGHADLLVIERAFDEKKGKLKKNISAEDARGIAPFLRKTAAEGGWRVVIVDGAEDLNTASQNALLKILEEPPEKTVLILTTTMPGGFLPTIRSRCRMVALEPLNDAILSKLIDSNIPKAVAEEKAMLTRFCKGSIGKAMQFYQDDGITLYKALLAVAQDLPNLNIANVHELAEKAGRGQGADETFETIAEIMTGWCERLAKAEAFGTPLADTYAGDGKIFAKLAATYPPQHFLQAYDKLRNLFGATQGLNLDKRQAIISAFLTLQQPGYEALSA